MQVLQYTATHTLIMMAAIDSLMSRRGIVAVVKEEMQSVGVSELGCRGCGAPYRDQPKEEDLQTPFTLITAVLSAADGRVPLSVLRCYVTAS